MYATTWQVTTFSETLLFSGVGFLALVASLHLLNGFALALGYATKWTFRYARVLEL